MPQSMTVFLKKYWLGILLFLTWCLLVLYFNPRQQQFYLDSDIEQFKKRPHLVLIVIEACLFILILMTNTRNKKEQIIKGSIYTLLYLFFFHVFFQTTFTSIGLYINRLSSRTDIKKSYIVQYLNGAEMDKNALYLYDIDKKKITTERKLLHRLPTDNFHQNDTLHIKFTNGLLGLPYLNSDR